MTHLCGWINYKHVIDGHKHLKPEPWIFFYVFEVFSWITIKWYTQNRNYQDFFFSNAIKVENLSIHLILLNKCSFNFSTSFLVKFKNNKQKTFFCQFSIKLKYFFFGSFWLYVHLSLSIHKTKKITKSCSVNLTGYNQKNIYNINKL